MIPEIFHIGIGSDRLEIALTTTDTNRDRHFEAFLHESLGPAAKTMETDK